MRDLLHVTVVETEPFIEDAARCLQDDEREELIAYLARNPTVGDLIRGTGGLRKVRWAASGRGKRGGVRVIYYFHSARIPLFLLTAYAKSRKVDITAAERVTMRRIAAEIVKHYTGRNRRRP